MTRLVNEPEAMVNLTTTVIRLMNYSGAADLVTITRELPYSGYSDPEIAEGLKKLEEMGIIRSVLTTDAVWAPIFYPWKKFPFPQPPKDT